MLYQRFKRLAAATGDPARLTKVESIATVARARINTLLSSVQLPTQAEIILKQRTLQRDGPLVPIQVFQAHEIRMYGRFRCQQMVNRGLPFVTSYNPNTDTGWPY